MAKNVRSHKQSCTIAQDLEFSDAKDLGKILMGSPPSGVRNTIGIG